MEDTPKITRILGITLVSHTHWDRAWYVTFQEFRTRLVRLVDRLIHLLESNPGFRVFMLDGQMAVLEDYLEVRPHRQPELERLCQQGRLKVGPWYVLADEFLVSPEALIRNLQLGHQVGKTYGDISKIGYVPDGFGHIAQLPQILRGFGIDNAFFWRGLGTEGERLGTEFTWKAPDDSAVTTIWMPFGYHNISNVGYGIHWGDTSQMLFDTGLALEQIQKTIQNLQPMSKTGMILLMNGIDHEEAEPRIPEVIESANEILGSELITHGTLEEHLAKIRQVQTELEEFCGEFRWGKYSEILQGVYATRIHLKQINQRIENLYERYAEPLSTFAWTSGADVPEGSQDLLWTGWRWLLKNHPHDDIYGSGIDAVHHEMLYRFDQAEHIGQIIVRDSLRQLCSQVNFNNQPGIPVLVWNPLGWSRNEIVTGDLDFEFDDPRAGNFQIVAATGEILPHQVLDDQEVFWMETLKANRKRRVRVAFPAQVPACGFNTVYVQDPAGSPRSIPTGIDWNLFENGAENRYLSFQINPDGGIDIYDKNSDVHYPGLGHFEDIEDAGDEYSFCPFQDSQPISTRSLPAKVQLTVNGPNLITYEIHRELALPASLTDNRENRSTDLVIIPIVSRVSLHRDQPGIFIETELTNHACDHKLSVVFPTQLNPQSAAVDQAFLVINRDIDLPDSTGWVEDPSPLMHQRSFINLNQSGHGLAIFNRGLPAVEANRLPGGVKLSLTLLRCVGWLSRDDLWTRRVAAGPLVPTPGAQCLGNYRFEYAIFPHTGDISEVYPAAYNYISPLLAARADTHEGLDLREMNITRDDPEMIRSIPWQRAGHLPDTVSFISVEGKELALSSVHRAKSLERDEKRGWIARFYNISGGPVSAQLTCWQPLQEAWLTDLEENRIEPLTLLDKNTLKIHVEGHKIITIELV